MFQPAQNGHNHYNNRMLYITTMLIQYNLYASDLFLYTCPLACG